MSNLHDNKHLTTCTLTDQGAQRIEFAEISSLGCMVQQSITPLENTPFGGAFLWLGTRQDPMRLDRQRVGELVNVLQTWLDTGKLVEEV